jgi:hypothetical protein
LFVAAALFVTGSIVAVSPAPAGAEAGKIEIIPMVGYQSGGTIKVRGGELHLDGSQNVALYVDFNIWTGAQFEVFYIRQDTKVSLADTTGAHQTDLFDAGIDYLQAGALLGASKGESSFFFSSVSIGMTHFNPKGVDVSDTWKLSVTVGVGTKVYFTDRLGMRIHGQLLPTFLTAGSDIFCDDNGCYSKVESGALLQWDVALGLIVRL